MEIKLLCNCGQKFRFDVEPMDGRMPFVVNCPACGSDCTELANAILPQAPATAAPFSPAAPGKLQINRTAAPSAAPAMSPQPSPVARTVSIAAPAAAAPKSAGEFNMGLGILGALLGAGVGVGIMYGFYLATNFRFPLLGVGIGALTGFGAKLLFKGTDNVLGVLSGVISLLAVVGTLYLIYGEFPIFNIISVVISVSVAYRIASG